MNPDTFDQSNRLTQMLHAQASQYLDMWDDGDLPELILGMDPIETPHMTKHEFINAVGDLMLTQDPCECGRHLQSGAAQRKACAAMIDDINNAGTVKGISSRNPCRDSWNWEIVDRLNDMMLKCNRICHKPKTLSSLRKQANSIDHIDAIAMALNIVSSTDPTKTVSERLKLLEDLMVTVKTPALYTPGQTFV